MFAKLLISFMFLFSSAPLAMAQGEMFEESNHSTKESQLKSQARATKTKNHSDDPTEVVMFTLVVLASLCVVGLTRLSQVKNSQYTNSEGNGGYRGWI